MPSRSPQSPASWDSHDVRRALLSVYYASLGREFELRGAPSVLLPPEIRPIGLGEALDVLHGRPERQAAVWRLLRSVPVRGRRPSAAAAELAYPAELVALLGKDVVLDLDSARRDHRRGASLFAAALVACAEGDWPQFQALQRLVEDHEACQAAPGFAAVTEQTLGQHPSEVLAALAGDGERSREWERSGERLQRLEDEVGLPPATFVLELADAAALLSRPGFGTRGDALRVYPVSCVIRQDTRSLTTTATVSTLVQCDDFDVLCRAVDPRGWSVASQVVLAARYVEDAFTLVPVQDEDLPVWGQGLPRPRLLEEHAVLSWGPDGDREGAFHNVLRIDQHSVQDQDIEVRFSLSRSIDSRLLWDARAGGILVNEGYLKVRQVTRDRWRVTSRKRLRFSDRTPYRQGQGWQDLGQALNFLAPAALAWWLESETYSMSAGEYTDPGALVTAS